jgi:hypothetical protein
VYDELRKLAAARMAAENPGHTLDATALVHEAYLRLTGTQSRARMEPGFGRRRPSSPDLDESCVRSQVIPTKAVHRVLVCALFHA